MPRAPFLVAASVALSGLLWSGRLILSPGPLAPDAGALLGVDLLATASVAAAGLLLARGRWARRSAAGVLGAQAGLAAVLPLDAWWWLALGGTGLGVAGLAGPWLTTRKRPSVAGPPPQATALALGLLAGPGLVAVAGWDGLGVGHWVSAAALAGTAWAYSRALVAGLWAARLLPLLAAPALLMTAPVLVPVLIVPTVLLAGLAWTDGARLAVSPLTPRLGRPVSIPPELVPPEVLEAAGLDRRGRRKDPS